MSRHFLLEHTTQNKSCRLNLLVLIKVDESVDVLCLGTGSPEFGHQGGGGGGQWFLEGINFPLDCSFLRLQLPHSLSGFLGARIQTQQCDNPQRDMPVHGENGS